MPSPQKLVVAKEKLNDTTIPLQLRVTYYLRIICLEIKPEGMSYGELMRALFTHNPEWLDTCDVTASGELRSTDPTINRLLQLIEQGYQAIASTIKHIPMAA